MLRARCQAGTAGCSSNSSVDKLLFSLPFLLGGLNLLLNLKVCPAASIVKTLEKQERSDIAVEDAKWYNPGGRQLGSIQVI